MARKIIVANSLAIPLKIVVRDSEQGKVESSLTPAADTKDHSQYELSFLSDHDVELHVYVFSGAFVKMAIATKEETRITVSKTDFADPYELPDPSEYEKQRFKETGHLFWLPPRPLNYIVDLGPMTTEKGSFAIIRSQQWCPISDGLSVAPGESLTHFSSIESGRHESSSTRKHIEENVSASASGGWGVFSASVSASMSTSNDVEHTVSTEEKKVTSQTVVYENKNESSVLVIVKWQLIEKIEFWLIQEGHDACSTASIISRKLPIITEAYRILDGQRIGNPE